MRSSLLLGSILFSSCLFFSFPLDSSQSCHKFESGSPQPPDRTGQRTCPAKLFFLFLLLLPFSCPLHKINKLPSYRFFHEIIKIMVFFCLLIFLKSPSSGRSTSPTARRLRIFRHFEAIAEKSWHVIDFNNKISRSLS